MSRVVSGKELLKFLSKKGFSIYSVKGSHFKLTNHERHAKTIVAMHKEIPKGTLNAIIRQAKLTDEEIRELIES